MRYISLFACLIFFAALTPASSQSDPDTVIIVQPVEKAKKGSIFKGRPGRAMLYSLVIPGAGQIYNKSYLRVPFVWGAVGGMGYLMNYNTRAYNCYRDAYKGIIDNTPYDPPASCPPAAKATIERISDARSMRLERDNANNARQLAIVGFTLVWLANGVDAFVDAHLKDFDIDEDLSIDFGTRMDDDPFTPVRAGMFVQF